MRILKFDINCIGESLPAVLLNNGDWIFNSGEVCVFAGIVSRKADASRWIKDNLPQKWWLEFKPEGVGRPGIYLTLSGFLYAISMGKSEIALGFRDEVYDNILPNVILKGGYISDKLTSEQIQALRQELDQRDAYIDHQEKTIDYLVDCKHVKEIVYQFAMNNIEYTPDKKYIASGTLWDMWVDWSDKHYHRRGRKLIKIYQEDFRKYMRELFPKTDKRFYVDPKNGYADVEHARVKPTIDPFGE